MSDASCNATIIRRHDLHEHLCIVRIRSDNGPVPPFEPGQFVKLGLPRDAQTTPEPGESRADAGGRIRLVRRAFSIASSAHERENLEIYLTRVEQGMLTPRLWHIDVGGRIWMDERAGGRFTLAGIPTGAHLVMVATGTGVAPFMSMLRTYAGAPRWRRLTLLHGVRQVRDLGYQAELEALSRQCRWFRYLPIVSREPAGTAWGGRRGRVQSLLSPPMFEQLTGEALSPETCEVMLCGNPAMIESVSAGLQERGFRPPAMGKPGNLHFERYW